MPNARSRATQRGNVAVITAVLLPVSLLAVAAGVDLQRWGSQRARLQEFADMLALRGAREFLLANAIPSQIESVVQSIVDSSL
ncbi:MAG: pilus assembly protein TadG-related protein, partial [Parvularculaceae bacterium]